MDEEQYINQISDLKAENLKLEEALKQSEAQKAVLEANMQGLLKSAVIEAFETARNEFFPKKVGTTGRPRVIKTSTKERIIELYQEGYSMRKIARECGVSLGAVTNTIYKRTTCKRRDKDQPLGKDAGPDPDQKGET